MARLTKPVLVLLLAVCLLIQGFSFLSLAQAQVGKSQVSNTLIAASEISETELPFTDDTRCCDHHVPHEELADKEKTKLYWELDALGAWEHFLHPADLGVVAYPSSDFSRYPTPIYTLHRPPKALA